MVQTFNHAYESDIVVFSNGIVLIDFTDMVQRYLSGM